MKMTAKQERELRTAMTKLRLVVNALSSDMVWEATDSVSFRDAKSVTVTVHGEQDTIIWTKTRDVK